MRLDQETPGPIGVGTKIRRRHTRGETPVEGEMEVVELEPDRSMGVVIRDGPMELSSRMIVEPEGEGHTRLTFEVESDDAPLEMMKDPIRGSLQRIKELIEAEA